MMCLVCVGCIFQVAMQGGSLHIKQIVAAVVQSTLIAQCYSPKVRCIFNRESTSLLSSVTTPVARRLSVDCCCITLGIRGQLYVQAIHRLMIRTSNTLPSSQDLLLVSIGLALLLSTSAKTNTYGFGQISRSDAFAAAFQLRSMIYDELLATHVCST